MQKFLITLLLASVCLQVLAAGPWQSAQYARYEQYKRPLFIARLQTLNQQFSANDLLLGRQGFLLELAIEAEFYSDRRFKRLWRESLAVNLSSSELDRRSNELNKLYQFIQYDLGRGDRFQVEFHPELGSVVSINNISELKFPQSDLGVLLLRGLIGEVPLSSEFKQAMLADSPESSNLVESFDQLVPSANRAAEIKQLLAAETSPKQPVAKQEVATRQTTAQEAPVQIATVQKKPEQKNLDQKAPIQQAAIQKVAAQKAAIQSVPVQKPTLPPGDAKQESSKALASVSVQSSVAEAVKSVETNDEKSKAGVPVPDQTLPKKDPKVKPQIAGRNVEALPAKQRTSPPEKVPVKNIEAPKLDAEVIEAATLAYQQEIERRIKKYKTIPFQAFSRRMEGDVVLALTVGKNGDLEQLELAQPSRYNVLNDQALDAASSAEPFAPIPKVLETEQFSFTVKLTYDLVY